MPLHEWRLGVVGKMITFNIQIEIDFTQKQVCLQIGTEEVRIPITSVIKFYIDLEMNYNWDLDTLIEKKKRCSEYINIMKILYEEHDSLMNMLIENIKIDWGLNNGKI